VLDGERRHFHLRDRIAGRQAGGRPAKRTISVTWHTSR
jgi:hypothetical protein